MSETAKFIIPNFANLPIHAFKGREVNVFSSMTVPDWKLKVEDVMLEVCEDVKCEVGGLCGRQLGGEESLLALRPPQPLLNTAFFMLIFFFLSTALIFLATIAVAIIIIKLTEIVGWLVEVRKETMIKKEHCENKGQKKHCQRHKGPRVLTI